MTYFNKTLPALLLSLAAGCGGASASGSGSASSAAPGSEYMGLYRGDWGTMVLRQVGDEVWGAYAHDGGAVRGRLAGDVFNGVWCEDPTRTDDSDAGYVRFIFGTAPDGTITIDGTWSYGSDAPNRENWDLTLQPGEQDAALDAAFADPSHFCPE